MDNETLIAAMLDAAARGDRATLAGLTHIHRHGGDVEDADEADALGDGADAGPAERVRQRMEAVVRQRVYGGTSPLTEAKDSRRSEGEIWQGKSGRYFTKRRGRVVPAKGKPKPQSRTKPVHTAPTAASEPVPAQTQQTKQTVIASLLSGASATGAGAARIWRKLKVAALKGRDPRTRKRIKRVAQLAAAVEHKVMIGFHKGKELAEEMAKERGASPEAAAMTARVIGVADQALAWTTTFPVVSAVTGNPAAGKVASFIPMASLAYLTYSTARNPLATLRAAYRVFVAKKATPLHEAEGESSRAEMMAVMDAITAAGEQADWFLALLHVALDRNGHDVSAALADAEEMFAQHPQSPEEEGGSSASLTEAELREALGE